MKPKPRIVLTGGPGAGKTLALLEIKKCLGKKTVISPEAASLLYNGGFPRHNSPQSICAAQKAIFHVQRNLEEALSHHAAQVLFLDRGTIDGAAYWPRGASHFFRTMGTSLTKELDRYDAVLFLQTAAMKIDKVRLGNNCRTESPKEAIALDQKLMRLWKNHPKFLYIPRQDTLEAKLSLAVERLKEIL